jgi:hypothetical protein
MNGPLVLAYNSIRRSGDFDRCSIEIVLAHLMKTHAIVSGGKYGAVKIVTDKAHNSVSLAFTLILSIISQRGTKIMFVDQWFRAASNPHTHTHCPHKLHLSIRCLHHNPTVVVSARSLLRTSNSQSWRDRRNSQQTGDPESPHFVSSSV